MAIKRSHSWGDHPSSTKRKRVGGIQCDPAAPLEKGDNPSERRGRNRNCYRPMRLSRRPHLLIGALTTPLGAGWALSSAPTMNPT